MWLNIDLSLIFNYLIIWWHVILYIYSITQYIKNDIVDKILMELVVKGLFTNKC